jgi:hypothetical protein
MRAGGFVLEDDSVKKLFLASLSIALLSLSAQARSPLEPAGVWTGTMTQVASPKDQNYMVNLTFKSDAIFTDYPELGCGGKLKLVGKTPDGYSIYHETITYGRLGDGSGANCIDGIAILSHVKGTITLGWFASDGGVPMQASAQLTRAAD